MLIPFCIILSKHAGPALQFPILCLSAWRSVSISVCLSDCLSNTLKRANDSSCHLSCSFAAFRPLSRQKDIIYVAPLNLYIILRLLVADVLNNRWMELPWHLLSLSPGGERYEDDSGAADDEVADIFRLSHFYLSQLLSLSLSHCLMAVPMYLSVSACFCRCPCSSFFLTLLLSSTFSGGSF